MMLENSQIGLSEYIKQISGPSLAISSWYLIVNTANFTQGNFFSIFYTTLTSNLIWQHIISHHKSGVCCWAFLNNAAADVSLFTLTASVICHGSNVLPLYSNPIISVHKVPMFLWHWRVEAHFFTTPSILVERFKKRSITRGRLWKISS